MPLSDIVNVQITRETQSVSEAGFGTLLILGSNKNWNDLIKKYSNMQEVAQDFNSYDPEFIAAQDVFAQKITPPFIYIGRRTVDDVDVLVETSLPGQTYTVTINGVNASISSTTSVNQSVVTLNNPLITDNLVNVSVNGTIVGTVTSVIDFDLSFTRSNSIVPTVNGVAQAAVPFDNAQSVLDFDIDFNAGNSIVATVNGVALSAVPFNTDQATTLADLLTEIKTASGV